MNKGTLQTLLQYCENAHKSLELVRLLIVGGETWYPDEFYQIRRYVGPKTRVINSYGVTEATVDNSYFEAGNKKYPGCLRVPIGRPFAHSELWILDGALNPVGIGIPGDLYIGGPGVAKGYWNRQELTDTRFLPPTHSNQIGARLYKTGDVARYLDDGNIEFFGRKDQQVKVRGFRIETGECEARLTQHQDVFEAAVIAYGEDAKPRELVAYVVPASKQVLVKQELQDFMKESLPNYMLPTVITILDSLPRTPTGKVDRQALPLPDRSSVVDVDNFIAPRTPIESLLADIWKEVLNLERIGVHDNFFNLGGHSLLATKVVARLRQVLELDIPLRTIFEQPTVEKLAQSLNIRLSAAFPDETLEVAE
jgi:acyl-coenzyme A synthetase/AMP-(fatty) acid ligase/acyl carrier protein